MNQDETQAAPPPIVPPGNPQCLPPILTGPNPINWRPVQALFFVMGIVLLFALGEVAHKVAVADGGKPDATLLGGIDFTSGLVISYFAISAVGMAFAKRKATLIPFALAAHLALLTAFVLNGHTTMTKYVATAGFSPRNVLFAGEEALFFLPFLSPWLGVWLLKLLLKEKHIA